MTTTNSARDVAFNAESPATYGSHDKFSNELGGKYLIAWCL
jgi:hypothetical protein